MDKDLSLVFICVIVFFTLLGFGIVLFVVYYHGKRKAFLKEKRLLQATFNQQLLQTQLEIQEQTFNIISQEIHDNVGQSLSLAKLQLHILKSGEVFDRSLLDETEDSVSKALTDLRDIAKSLHSERIQQYNLSEIISQELMRINRLGFLLTNIQVEGEERSLPVQKKLIIFRIVQETLQNVIKHANAKNIDVKCQYHDDKLEIKVSDNGNGFDKNLLTKKDGLGLSNIMNRCALIGGDAKIESIINEGTTITIITPYI